MQDKEPWIVAKKLAIINSSESGTLQTSNENANGQNFTDSKIPLSGGGGASQAQIDNCLHICLQLTANLAIFINPFLPNAAKRICVMMKTVDKMLEWENGGSVKLLSVGYSLRPPELLFRKIEDIEVAEQIQKLKIKSAAIKMEKQKADDGQQTTDHGPRTTDDGPRTTDETSKLITDNKVLGSKAPPSEGFREALKSEIVFDDFAKIDLKVGTIIAAEKVEKADKLLKLEVDLGFETRTIVSGIALHFNAVDIVGKQVTVVTNLAPRKMRGIESNGMILMAEDADGKLKFIGPGETVSNGSGVS